MDKKMVAGWKCLEVVDCSEVTFGVQASDDTSANGNNVINAGTANRGIEKISFAQQGFSKR